MADLAPGQFIRAYIQAAPALGVGNEARHRHRPLGHGRQRHADFHVLPIAFARAADFLGLIQLVNSLQVGIRVDVRRSAPQFHVFCAFLARLIAVGPKAPAIRFRDKVAIGVEEVHVINLLDGAAGEPGLMLDQVF